MEVKYWGMYPPGFAALSITSLNRRNQGIIKHKSILQIIIYSFVINLFHNSQQGFARSLNYRLMQWRFVLSFLLYDRTKWCTSSLAYFCLGCLLFSIYCCKCQCSESMLMMNSGQNARGQNARGQNARRQNDR